MSADAPAAPAHSQTPPGLIVREATRADVDTVHRLIVAIAEHHDQRQHVRTTPALLREGGFGPTPRFGVLLAETGGEVAGYASYTWNYAIWLGGEFMNIDDVFVHERFRGRQVGEALMHRARAADLARRAAAALGGAGRQRRRDPLLPAAGRDDADQGHLPLGCGVTARRWPSRAR